jgi:hypothetical protein
VGFRVAGDSSESAFNHDDGADSGAALGDDPSKATGPPVTSAVSRASRIVPAVMRWPRLRGHGGQAAGRGHPCLSLVVSLALQYRLWICATTMAVFQQPNASYHAMADMSAPVTSLYRFGDVAQNVEALGSGRHDEHRQSPMALGLGIGNRKDQRES